MLKLLQICNVGQMTGGTAACAWTVARSLPDLQHKIVFRGSISAEGREQFQEWEPERWDAITAERVARSRADLVLLHNISRGSLGERVVCPTVNYLHSRISPAMADVWICCSEWLREQYGRPELRVMRQAVPRPRSPQVSEDVRGASEKLIIGRLCTPTARKWWNGLPEFYVRLARRFPDVLWEFVGCPEELQSPVARACEERARFFPAGWEARSLLGRWDAMLYHHPELTESFGRTVGDAFRAGCIPIVDRRGGFVEQINGGPGFLCANEQEFAQAIQQISDPVRRQQESERCLVWGEAHYSLRDFRRQLLNVFQDTAERFLNRQPQAAR